MHNKLQSLFRSFSVVFDDSVADVCDHFLLDGWLVLAINHSQKLNSVTAILADSIALGSLYVTVVILVLFASLTSEGMQVKKVDTLQKLTELKYSFKCTHQKLVEIECVREYVQNLILTFTALNFFKLDRSLLLSMISSLLPLSVLLCQLSGAI